MALLGSSVDPRLFMQDYSGFTRAAEIQAQGMQNLGAAIGQGIKDFGEAREERKKLDAQVKADDVSIESAIKLGESLGIDIKSYLEPIQALRKDPNTTPAQSLALGRAAAQGISNAFTLGIGAQERQSALERARVDAQYKQGMLEASQTRAAASLLGAKAAAQPNYTFQEYNVKNPVTGEDEKSKLPVNPKTGRPRDIEANRDILNVQDWYENKGGLAPEEPAMPIPTSQNEIIAPSTAYSFGKAVGGPDELQDKWTNKGYTSTGPNLVEGVVAVNTNKYPLGTIFKDSESGKVYVAADRHGNKDSSVIDFFQNPENYTGGKTNKRLSIIGAVPKNKIPKTKEGMSQLIEQYSNVPDYSTSSNASQIDNAISMGGDMTQQAMGTPQQQAEIARMIEEGQGMAMAQNMPQGAMPTEPSMATQQPQLPQQAAPKVNLRPGFAPVRLQGNKPTTKMTAEQVANLAAQGFKVNALPTDDGNFMVSGATVGGGSGTTFDFDPKTGRVTVTQGASKVGQTAKAEEKAKAVATGLTQDLYALKDRYTGLSAGTGPIPALSRLGASAVPGTPAAGVKEIADRVTAGLTIENIMSARRSNASGAALGGSTSDKDMKILERASTSLSAVQNPEEFNREWTRIMEAQLNIAYGTPEQRANLVKEGKITEQYNKQVEDLYPDETINMKGQLIPRVKTATPNVKSPVSSETQAILDRYGKGQ